MQLPWTLETVPHAVLDILRGCNIRCLDCYNSRPDRIKTLTEIDADLDVLTRLRKLQSLSIVGGEITLHPDLVEIVRRVRQRGLFAELFTNGVELNDRLLTALKQAGANVIFLHIESQQRRPDLPTSASPAELRQLREEKVALVAAHGIEVGLAVTVYPDKHDELKDAVNFTLESEHACYLLATAWRDVGAMPALRGDLSAGLFAMPGPARPKGQEKKETFESFMDAHFGLKPFAALGSNIDQSDARWVSYMIGTAHRDGKLVQWRGLKSTLVEKLFLQLSYKWSGHYPFYQPQNSRQFFLHVLLNALAGGGLRNNLQLLGKTRGARLSAKRLLFQRPATVDDQGRLIHCHCCPDAVVKDGHMVPLCICDRVETENSLPT